MKLFIATVLCAALSAEACGRSPRIVYERCVSSGDPHYTPVHGRKEKFTRMGEGEFTLAALPAYRKNGVDVGDFGVHACQHDVSKSSRTGSMKARTITWNRDVVAWEGSTKVEIESHFGTHGKVKITQANGSVVAALLSRVKSTGWYRRRLATAVTAAPAGTQFVGRIATSGNTGLSAGASGTSGTSFSSSLAGGSNNAGAPVGNFGARPPTAPAGSSSAGLSAGMTALVALVSVGALALAAVGAKKYRENFTASKPQAASREMATTGAGAAKEDCTDVL